MKNDSFFEDTSKITIVVGAVIFIGSFFFLLSPNKLPDWASLGDITGGLVASLWALGGVLLFYAALKSQQESLKDQKDSTRANIEAVRKQTESLELQMKEFELQRKELEETRKVFEDQSETLGLQRFENTFFNLLSLKRELFNSIYCMKSGGEIAFGIEAYRKLWNQFSSDFQSGSDKTISFVLTKFSFFYEKNKNNLDHYFSSLFYMFEMLDRSNPSNKKDYINLFVGNLSEIDKIYLFYLGVKPGVGNHIKTLIEKYHLLRYLNPQHLIDPSHTSVYSTLAFTPYSV